MQKDTSLFRKIPVSELSAFQWEQLIDELRLRHQCWFAFWKPSHPSSRTLEAFTNYPGICMVSAVLLKEKNREMCGFQSLISVPLYATHAEKEVTSMLTKFIWAIKSLV